MPTIARQDYFSDACKDWRLSGWSNAALGELGEAANIIKKIERGDYKDNHQVIGIFQNNLAKELADAVLYIDLLAWKAGISLDLAIKGKFNETSEKIGSKVLL